MGIKTSVKLNKPHQRWVFGGIGFQNSEASMTGVMTDDFKNQVALKCFREISPTYARVFTGFAYWNKPDMDRFADYYDQTFRKANTTLYVVPWRMPYRDKHFDMEDYAERVASNLEYLIKERKCTKIRHYCLTNELAIGKDRKTLNYNLPLFKDMQETLYSAFRRHDLNVGLVSLDSSGFENPWPKMDWAVANLADTSECFCHHFYFWDVTAGDESFYNKLTWTLDLMVKRCFSQEKRFVLGEFGFKVHGKPSTGCMGLDEATHVSFPELEGEAALQYAEACTAVINTGCYSSCVWTFIDYPDPMISEDGDTEQEKARFDAIRFSGRGMHSTYNKNGMIRWCDEEKDYRAYAPYYTMGLMAKYFRKGSRVLIPEFEDSELRVSGVTNPDGSYSVCVVNYGEEKTIDFTNEHKSDKPLRQYSYDSKNPPYNDFNDLQNYDKIICVKDNNFTITIPAKAMVVLTTDYQDRKPTEIDGIKVENDKLIWNACQDTEHTYYRVYKDGKQIASTVVEYLSIADEKANYEVYSVDKYGNCLK